MSGRPNNRNDPAEVDRSLRSLEAAVAELGEKVVQLHKQLVAAKNRQTDRIEAVIRDALADALHRTDSELPPCKRAESCPQSLSWKE
ncbi:MAG TPA: hypothetical protein VFX16_18655 [Pseudonocardiaceae bacterium]|nr:hypothetical protein [Pseudonocardiaceae bacterium]